ncbi:metalloregulator ArsR/SmtB family transcription factor [soil metagenome]
MVPTGAEDAVFAALADPTRRRLLALVGERGEVTATQLAVELPVTRQAVHKHLASLEGAGLVRGARTGREVRYRLTPAPLSDAMAWMTTVGAQWDARLAALERHLKR